jgi:hypothetical protein
MSCQKCGHKREGDVQPHNYGCSESRAAKARYAPESERETTREGECIKDGCTEPRAVSKGPRPAKYCDEHKTARSK